MKNKKGKRFKKKIVNKFKFIRSISILIILIVAIVLLIIHITGNKEGNESKQEASVEVSGEENIKSESGQEVIETSSEGTNGETQTEVIAEEKIEEEEKKEVVSEEVKNLIEQTRAENNLTENNFACFYYNVDTKEYYFYNEDKYFTAASTIKVPVSMVYYDKINKGELTTESKLIYEQGDYEAGAGRTAATYKVGSKIPLSFLIEEAIINSDNTAVNILIGNLGYRNCKKKIAKYTEAEVPETFYSSNILSAKFAYDIINHLYNNQGNYTQLIEYMKQSSNGQYLKGNLEQYDVVHKYGSYNGYVHDYGIIYGKNTYLVGVFTYGIPEANTFIANLGEKIVETVESDDGTTIQTEGETNVSETAE